jgi:hypothetical protein
MAIIHHDMTVAEDNRFNFSFAFHVIQREALVSVAGLPV